MSALNGALEWYHAGGASVETIASELTELFLNGIQERRRGKPRPIR
jgi:hypothetical protein